MQQGHFSYAKFSMCKYKACSGEQSAYCSPYQYRYKHGTKFIGETTYKSGRCRLISAVSDYVGKKIDINKPMSIPIKIPNTKR